MTRPLDNADLQALLDRDAVRELVARYCRAIDRCDLELLQSVYHPGAYEEHGRFKGPASDFVVWAMEHLHANWQRTHHLIGNQLVDLNGDSARCETYLTARHLEVQGAETTEYVFHARYVDRCEKRDGRWGIVYRVVVHDWSEKRPITLAYELDDETFVHSRRSRDDASYRV